MSGQGDSVTLVKLDLAIRADRRRVFGSEIAPPDSWDLILVLYLADAEGRRLTVREVIEESGGCVRVGRRRIAHLSHAGVIVGDGDGALDDVVTLAPLSITQVEMLVESAWRGLQSV